LIIVVPVIVPFIHWLASKRKIRIFIAPLPLFGKRSEMYINLNLDPEINSGWQEEGGFSIKVFENDEMVE